ncbi:hypothetical protein CTEN210_08566 [Chaetoceros tenuissimus]|uniref:Uncharacterized protein n=1 Tax=Chaetoceros tenuissimus TaxID=426638 RepID=A0AAD3CW45_9STRA|nr:hypothetical protein CTEN210_08566 [Chaetoceros tenuissimus]
MENLLRYTIIFLNSLVLGYSFSPIIPPKFDDFCEQIVGKYATNVGNEQTNIAEVQEVMRSCGGAIQGIKELSHDNSGDLYHNRADDGFVYFSCGSYIQGPTDLGEDDSIPLLASLSFNTLPKCRITFDCNSQTLIKQYRVFDGTINNNAPELNLSLESSNTLFEDFDIQFGLETVCRMDSGSSPWMLQRAKWEKQVFSENDLIQEKMKIDKDDLDIVGQIHVWDITNQEGIRENASLQRYFEDGDYSKTIQITALCKSTQEVKSMFRCYNKKKQLKAVVLQEGKAM